VVLALQNPTAMPLVRPIRSIVLLAAVAAVAAACGDGGRTRTGLDPDRPLSDLDEQEMELVCRTLYHSDLGLDDDELHRWGCYVGAIALGRAFPFLIDCDEAARDCLADPEPEGPGAEDCDLDAEDLDELPACAADVTVGDIERCLDEVGALARDLVDSLTCDIDADLVLDLPSVCAEIEAACPGLLEG
jgi:hypothetical protein